MIDSYLKTEGTVTDMRQVFNPDNALWRGLAVCVDVVGLSIAWLLLCLPVVTIGPACAALYYTVVKCLRQKEQGTFGVFFRAFRDNFKQGAVVTLICLPVAAALVFGYVVMQAHWGSPLGAVMFVAYDVALLVPAGLVCWLFPLLGRFRFSLKELFSTALILTFRHLPSTVVVVLLTLEVGVACVQRWALALFLPALCALLTSLFFEKRFLKYLSDEDKRRMTDTSETPLDGDEEGRRGP